MKVDRFATKNRSKNNSIGVASACRLRRTEDPSVAPIDGSIGVSMNGMLARCLQIRRSGLLKYVKGCAALTHSEEAPTGNALRSGRRNEKNGARAMAEDFVLKKLT